MLDLIKAWESWLILRNQVTGLTDKLCTRHPFSIHPSIPIISRSTSQLVGGRKLVRHFRRPPRPFPPINKREFLGKPKQIRRRPKSANGAIVRRHVYPRPISEGKFQSSFPRWFHPPPLPPSLLVVRTNRYPRERDPRESILHFYETIWNFLRDTFFFLCVLFLWEGRRRGKERSSIVRLTRGRWWGGGEKGWRIGCKWKGANFERFYHGSSTGNWGFCFDDWWKHDGRVSLVTTGIERVC